MSSPTSRSATRLRGERTATSPGIRDDEYAGQRRQSAALFPVCDHRGNELAGVDKAPINERAMIAFRERARCEALHAPDARRRTVERRA